MIQITAQMRVLVAIEPADGRNGIDGLVQPCQDKLAEDPFSGCVFVFRHPWLDDDQIMKLWRPGLLAGAKAIVEGPFHLVAGIGERR